MIKTLLSYKTRTSRPSRQRRSTSSLGPFLIATESKLNCPTTCPKQTIRSHHPPQHHHHPQVPVGVPFRALAYAVVYLSTFICHPATARAKASTGMSRMDRYRPA